MPVALLFDFCLSISYNPSVHVIHGYWRDFARWYNVPVSNSIATVMSRRCNQSLGVKELTSTHDVCLA